MSHQSSSERFFEQDDINPGLYKEVGTDNVYTLQQIDEIKKQDTGITVVIFDNMTAVNAAGITPVHSGEATPRGQDPGIRNFVQDPVNGLLFQEKDTEDFYIMDEIREMVLNGGSLISITYTGGSVPSWLKDDSIL